MKPLCPLLLMLLPCLLTSGCIDWKGGMERTAFENSATAKAGKNFGEYTDVNDKAKQDYDMARERQ